MTTLALQQADEGVLRRSLEGTLRELFGSASAVAGVSRSPSGLSTSYETYLVTVRLAAGGEFTVFLKDFGVSRLPKGGPAERRERERRVYADLLAGADLGTARYYGSVWDEERGRFWLLLEFVRGTEVCDLDFEYWVAAAGWLGRMHAHFAPRAGRLRACDYLVRHDADFFHATAAKALRAAGHFSPGLEGRLAPLLPRYGRAVAAMTGQPATLVHGTYRPGQIVVDAGRRPWRVCPVDWEMAALGSGFYDLAYIADGFRPPRLDELVAAYRHEALNAGLAVPPHDRVIAIVDCYRFHRILNWLSKAAELRYAEGDVVKLVDMAEQLAAHVL